MVEEKEEKTSEKLKVPHSGEYPYNIHRRGFPRRGSNYRDLVLTGSSLARAILFRAVPTLLPRFPAMQPNKQGPYLRSVDLRVLNI